jgi:hypothetical protein
MAAAAVNQGEHGIGHRVEADARQGRQVVRRVRPPEPYKGKGIRYEGEVVKRKAGKAFVAAE